MSLSGWSDSIYVDHGTNVTDNLSPGAYGFWFYTTSDTPREVLGGKHGSYRIEVSENQTPSILSAVFNCSAGSCTVSADLVDFSSYGINKWVFLVVTWDYAGGSVETWMGDVDNLPTEPSSYTAQTSDTTPGADDSGDQWRVGRHPTATGRSWVGRLGSFFVVDKFLTQEDIWELYSTGKVNDATMLLHAEYGYNGATGNVADYSGNGNTGTVNGTPTLEDHVPKPPLFGLDTPWRQAPAPVAGVFDIFNSGIISGAA